MVDCPSTLITIKQQNFQPEEFINITCSGDVEHDGDITFSLDGTIYDYSNTIEGVEIEPHNIHSNSKSVLVDFRLKFNTSRNGSIFRCCYYNNINTNCNETLQIYQLQVQYEHAPTSTRGISID